MRFKTWQFWSIVILFVVDLVSVFIPLASTALFVLAIFFPATLRRLARWYADYGLLTVTFLRRRHDL